MPAKHKRILIVDDDEDSLANLADILSEVGYETATATNGSRALQLVQPAGNSTECQFDLCLFDFKMPEMDGVELLRQIQEKAPITRAIMITAYAGENGVQRALAAGTWQVIPKPIDVSHLLSVIAEAFDSN